MSYEYNSKSAPPPVWSGQSEVIQEVQAIPMSGGYNPSFAQPYDSSSNVIYSGGNGVIQELGYTSQHFANPSSVGVDELYLAPKLNKLTKVITIFENERYSPMSGWSSKGLLPTDRNAVTSEDGETGWKVMDEASVDLLSLGKQNLR